MLPVILLSILMILLSTKCDQPSDPWQQLELSCEFESDLRDTVDWGSKWLVDFNAGKIQLVSFDQSKNTGAIDVKMGGSVLEEKSFFKILGLSASSKLDWCSCISSIAKTASKNFCRAFGSSLAASLEPLGRRNVASLSLFYKYCFGKCSSELGELVPLPYSRGRSSRYSDRLYDVSVTILSWNKDVSIKSFFPRTTKLSSKVANNLSLLTDSKMLWSRDF